MQFPMFVMFVCPAEKGKIAQATTVSCNTVQSQGGCILMHCLETGSFLGSFWLDSDHSTRKSEDGGWLQYSAVSIRFLSHPTFDDDPCGSQWYLSSAGWKQSPDTEFGWSTGSTHRHCWLLCFFLLVETLAYTIKIAGFWGVSSPQKYVVMIYSRYIDM